MPTFPASGGFLHIGRSLNDERGPVLDGSVTVDRRQADMPFFLLVNDGGEGRVHKSLRGLYPSYDL